MLALEIDLDGRADHGIVIDDENACHVSPRKRITYFQSNHSSVAIMMGLSGFFGLTGGVGNFRRLLRVDESTERRVASPGSSARICPLPQNVRRRARDAGETIARAVLPCESVHYRISAAYRRSVCPPQGIRSAPPPGSIKLKRPAIVDAKRSICRGRCKRYGALPIVAGSGVSVALPPSMQRPAICCVQMRRTRLASGSRKQIDIIDIDGLAEGLVRTLLGYLTG